MLPAYAMFQAGKSISSSDYWMVIHSCTYTFFLIATLSMSFFAFAFLNALFGGKNSIIIAITII